MWSTKVSEQSVLGVDVDVGSVVMSTRTGQSVLFSLSSSNTANAGKQERISKGRTGQSLPPTLRWGCHRGFQRAIQEILGFIYPDRNLSHARTFAEPVPFRSWGDSAWNFDCRSIRRRRMNAESWPSTNLKLQEHLGLIHCY